MRSGGRFLLARRRGINLIKIEVQLRIFLKCTQMRLVFLLFTLVQGIFTTKREAIITGGAETFTLVKNCSGMLRGIYARDATTVACFDGDCPAASGTCFKNGPIIPYNTIWDTMGTLYIKPVTGIPFQTSLCCCTYCGGTPCGAVVWYD